MANPKHNPNRMSLALTIRLNMQVLTPKRAPAIHNHVPRQPTQYSIPGPVLVLSRAPEGCIGLRTHQTRVSTQDCRKKRKRKGGSSPQERLSSIPETSRLWIAC